MHEPEILFQNRMQRNGIIIRLSSSTVGKIIYVMNITTKYVTVHYSSINVYYYIRTYH